MSAPVAPAAIAATARPDSRMLERRNELLTDLHALLEQQLQAHDLSANAAHVVASSLIDHLADHWGGQNISFPKDYKYKLSRLELEIYDKFTGKNFDALALAYDLSERGMRKLIARVRRKLASKNKNQSGLFDVAQEGASPAG